MLLEIENLYAGIDSAEILKGISLTVKAGEVHSIMGPNGHGKSTLSKVLAGHPDYQVTGGTATLNEVDLFSLEPEERARHGLFLAYQYPVELPGVNNAEFLRLAYNARRRFLGEEEADPLDFDELLREKMKMLSMDDRFRERSVNDGFSGGEKKKNEILQMALLQPRLAILDEIDSGLDIDALRVVAENLNTLRTPETAMILITHYQRLLDYIKPDYVHILNQGKIIATGGPELAQRLEEMGYEKLVAEVL